MRIVSFGMLVASFAIGCGPSGSGDPLRGSDSGSQSDSGVDTDSEPLLAPWVLLLRPTGDGTWYADQPIFFEATVADDDSALSGLTLSWSSSLDGELSAVDRTLGENGDVAGLGFLTEGEHLITVTVTDDDDNTGSDESTIVVGPPNRAPVCEIVTPIEEAVGLAGAMTPIRVAANDPDSGPLDLAVTLSSDQMGHLGSLGLNANGEGFFPAELTTTTHLLTLRVQDEFGQTCVATRSHRVSAE